MCLILLLFAVMMLGNRGVTGMLSASGDMSTKAILCLSRASSSRPLLATSVRSVGSVSDKLSFPVWLREVFRGQISALQVSPLHVDPKRVHEILNTWQDAGCIIDDPSRTMAHPMLGFDVEEASQKILDASKERPNPRFKSVVAIARGMGGGKTRSMEEMRRNLLRRKTILPIAITFNGKSDVFSDPWREENNYDALSVEQVYALSVSARMLSAVFGISFSKTANVIYANFFRLDLKSVDASTMIQETIEFLLLCVNDERALFSINLVDTVVLLMDENGRADCAFGKNDLGAIVRRAILDDNKFNNKNITRITLVISDLGFLPEPLRTRPARRVKVLVLPARLPTDKVLSEWWFRRGEVDKFSPEQLHIYRSVVALLNNMPRALQFTAEFLRSQNINMEDDTNPTFLMQMFDYIFESAYDLYLPLEPPKDVLVAAFFREKILLDENLLEAVKSSIVTNPLSKFVHGSSIVPDVSLVLLEALSLRSSSSPSVKLIGEGIRKVRAALLPCIRDGDVLEEAVLQALRARLALAKNIKGVTLARLCGLSKVFWDEDEVEFQKQSIINNLGLATAEALFAPIATNVLMYSGQVDTLTACSHQNNERFLKELDSFEVSELVPVRILRPADNGEAWDVCVVNFDSVTKKPFRVFLDCQACRRSKRQVYSQDHSRSKATPAHERSLGLVERLCLCLLEHARRRRLLYTSVACNKRGKCSCFSMHRS